MNQSSITLFDDLQIREQLLPFTYTRSIADIRIGITTIVEKWISFFGSSTFYIKTEDYLQTRYSQGGGSSLFINACIIPDEALVAAISALKEDQYLIKGVRTIAIANTDSMNLSDKVAVEYTDDVLVIEQPWDIFKKNEAVLTADFYRLTKGRVSQPLATTNTLIGDTSRLFIEEGATIEAAVLNTNTGVIYIGKEAEIMEGTVVRGPLAMCEHSAIKLAGKIYGATTLGPHVKVGGEVNNSVIFGYSNKGHDGFLGNSVIGEWCNLGADTNNSNLKNNYGEVKVWSYAKGQEINTGLQFCGLMMGDHSKCGINTMFNTGTVVGVSANIFGAGFPPKHIPSFSWGGAEEMVDFDLEKAMEVAERMMERRHIALTEIDKNILKNIYEATQKFRSN
jgi:UDP-N-acetylglucosamine diphosphorylase/glucosamine-1-phosphate N-acetyltransferase